MPALGGAKLSGKRVRRFSALTSSILLCVAVKRKNLCIGAYRDASNNKKNAEVNFFNPTKIALEMVDQLIRDH